MNKTANKIVLVGTGAVGTSFIYAAINQGLASRYVLIDISENSAKGNAMDIVDGMTLVPQPFGTIKAGTYEDCSDADLIVITAGRPQLPGETRLDMVSGNAKIMKEIALKIKASGFSGVTLIASNPVDVLTSVYQEVTNFDPHMVVGSGTTLDSARLTRQVANYFGINPISIHAHLIGEHGDSSVAIWSHASVMGKPINEYIKQGKITKKELDEFKENAVKAAYKIIELKRATYYGIGICLTRIARAVLFDEKTTLMVGAQLNGEYGQSGMYIGVPAVIGENGWERIVEWELSKNEQAGFAKSCEALKVSLNKAKEAIQ